MPDGAIAERKTWERILAYYVIATIGVLLLTEIIHYLHLDWHSGNVSMLYLMLVIGVALLLGRGPAIWVSLCSFLAFNWFFVEPRYTFDVYAAVDWSALITFLVIASVTGQLMAMLKLRAAEARQRQLETAALAEASWAVASQLDVSSALREVLNQISRVIKLQSATFVSTEKDAPQVVACIPPELGVVDSPGSLRLPVALKEAEFGYLLLKLPENYQLGPHQKKVLDALIMHSAVILQREKLRRTEVEAQALADADRMKTALLSMVSHDFRSPLTSIKASVSTLMQEEKPGSPRLEAETRQVLLDAIEQETDRLNRMVGSILDLSRLESNAWRPRLEMTPVSELIGMALDQFSKENNDRIVVELDPGLAEINVDCVQFVQVLKNLVENALKYSPPGSKVEIRSYRRNNQGILEVLDRGRGLASQDIDLLFEPFYRSHDLQESNVPGVGVGLALCRGLVEAHGGDVTAQNRDDGGAIFRVSLPLSARENTTQS